MAHVTIARNFDPRLPMPATTEAVKMSAERRVMQNARTSDDPLLGSRHWWSRLASVEAAAIAGIICAVGWSIGLRGLLGGPAIDATDAEIIRYYSEPDAGRPAPTIYVFPAWIALVSIVLLIRRPPRGFALDTSDAE